MACQQSKEAAALQASSAFWLQAKLQPCTQDAAATPEQQHQLQLFEQSTFDNERACGLGRQTSLERFPDALAHHKVCISDDPPLTDRWW